MPSAQPCPQCPELHRFSTDVETRVGIPATRLTLFDDFIRIDPIEKRPRSHRQIDAAKQTRESPMTERPKLTHEEKCIRSNRQRRR